MNYVTKVFITVFFTLLTHFGRAQLPNQVPPLAPSAKSTQEELLTGKAADAWHRNFVKSWNEWMLTKSKVPDFALKSKTLLGLAKVVMSSKRVVVTAHTSNTIVNFVTNKNDLAQSAESTAAKRAALQGAPTTHRLSIRVLAWPKVLVNGNTFEFGEKKTLEEIYRALKKTHHYEMLSTKEIKNEFALAALSYMAAMRGASIQVKVGSRMRMQKPSAAQIAGASKGMPSTIPGLSEGVTMMNMRNASTRPKLPEGFQKNFKGPSRKEESFWSRSKAFFKKYWSRTL